MYAEWFPHCSADECATPEFHPTPAITFRLDRALREYLRKGGTLEPGAVIPMDTAA
jgi:hypothetical protein